MKYLLSFLLALSMLGLTAQDQPTQDQPTQDKPPRAFLEDVSSVDNILTALYASISGGKGVSRQWDRFRFLLHPEAKLIPLQVPKEGKKVLNYIEPETYIKMANDYFLENGFFEEEIHREEQHFGPVVHVFSTYISRRTEDGEPFARGINSIQLAHDGERWWIVNIYWTAESKELPIPKRYLPK
ncbi:MAG: hypothetical protein AAFR61_29615 [Bacteroidota bacterium]